MKMQVHLSSLFFPTAVDKSLKQGKRRKRREFHEQKMGRMYSTEFSKKVPISKVEQVIDGNCFLPEGSNSKPQNLVRVSSNCQRLYSF